ncbi:hypothetical protein PQ610_01230 [Tardisphaera miroshnichenkoae]
MSASPMISAMAKSNIPVRLPSLTVTTNDMKIRNAISVAHDTSSRIMAPA